VIFTTDFLVPCPSMPRAATVCRSEVNNRGNIAMLAS
jgi:hypothetical protein